MEIPISVVAHRSGSRRNPHAGVMGLRFRRPLLHDGSAATHEEAVLRHGGEAANAAELYRTLPADDRRALLAFLDSL